MALTGKIVQKQTQKLTLTHQLIQSIELLQLSNLELVEKIANELLENPVLEEDPSLMQQTSTQDEGELISRVTRELSGDAPVYEKREEEERIYENSGDSTYSAINGEDRNRRFIENAVAHEETLKEHLGTQARLIAKDKEEFMLLENVITSIDDNGFLTSDIEVIAGESGVTQERLNEIITIVNYLDPVGCGVRTVREGLLIQAKHYYPQDKVLFSIIKDYFADFEKLCYEKIARALNITPAEVIEKGRLVQNLDPFPGRQYTSQKTKYIIPDVEVRYVDGEIFVTLNDDWIPGIRINSYYRDIIKKKGTDKKLHDYVKDKINSAKYLIKSIAGRRETILNVVSAIMEHQREFLSGGIGHLKPLIYADIANVVGMHESTISRVANNKFVQTPWGIFELKYFFVSRLKSSDNEDHSSDEAMNYITHIIAEENPMHPVSDGEILEKLREKGIKLARRTVAKYRSILNIPSSIMRKKLNIIRHEENK